MDASRLADIRHPEKCHSGIREDACDILQPMTIGTRLDHRHHRHAGPDIRRHPQVVPQRPAIDFRPGPRRRYVRFSLHGGILAIHANLTSRLPPMP